MNNVPPPPTEYNHNWMYMFWSRVIGSVTGSSDILAMRTFLGSFPQSPSVTVAGSEDILKNRIFGDY